MKASFSHLALHFKQPSGTSRGVLHVKNSWIIKLSNSQGSGVGEISVIEGLSPEYKDFKSFEEKVKSFCDSIEKEEQFTENAFLDANPSIKFGYETALLDLNNGGDGIIFDNDFSRGVQKIAINGLVWMGEESFMKEQIEQKIADGFTTIKMKVGAIDFETEVKLLRSIRNKFSSNQITLRVDANGAFMPKDALQILKVLSELEIHSIEQPIIAGQWSAMKELCAQTPTPIALDEELIGITTISEKIALLETIQPQFIILKPSLHGGISGTQEWIKLATDRNIPWWMTSALESNIGLNAICQLAGEYQNELPQGLGTGSLYMNNTQSNLTVENGMIFLKKG